MYFAVMAVHKNYSLCVALGESIIPAMIRHHMMENVTRHHELMRYTVKVNNLLKVFGRCFAYYILNNVFLPYGNKGDTYLSSESAYAGSAVGGGHCGGRLRREV